MCILLIFLGVIYVVKIKYTVSSVDFYFFSVNSLQDAESASLYAQEVRAKGGAGYVYYDQREYIVIASVYTDKEIAEKISQKNGGKVVKRSLPSRSFLDKNQTDATKRAYEKVLAYLKGLTTISYEYDCKRESLESVKRELIYYENAIKNEDLPIFSSLELCPADYLDSVKIKYYACELAFVAYKYFC